MEQPLAGMGMVNYLLVKSRPRQKLPTQSRKAHLLERPPSPPPRLQLMAAAACYGCWPAAPHSQSQQLLLLLLPGLSSSPPGSKSNPWSWSWTWRYWPTRWPVTLSRGCSPPHLPLFPCGWGSVDATRGRAEPSNRRSVGLVSESTGARHLAPARSIKLRKKIHF